MIDDRLRQGALAGKREKWSPEVVGYSINGGGLG